MTARSLLDFRAGAPWSEYALAALSRSAGAAWADPSHPSSEGRRSAVWLEAARATVRDLSGYAHVTFMSGRDSAMLAALEALDRPWTTSATNRQFLLRRLPRSVPVDSDGQAHFEDVPGSEGQRVRVLQAGNEETGVIDAVVEGRVVLDASATFARAPLPMDAEVVLADARAWGSPTDVAIVLSRRPLGLSDSAQVPQVVVAVDQLSRVMPGMAQRSHDESRAIEAFEGKLRGLLADVQFHGRQRVAHIRSFSILHLDAETIMRALDQQGFVVGSGSACVLDGRPSHVLAAMGRITHGNLRLALPWDLDLAVLDRFAEAVANTAQALRVEAGVDDL